MEPIQTGPFHKGSTHPQHGSAPNAPNQPDQPSRRHPKTTRQYQTLARQIERQAAAFLYPEDKDDEGFLTTAQCFPTEIADEFDRWATVPHRNRGTFDVYRSALMWAFSQGIFSDRPGAREAYLRVRDMRSTAQRVGKSNRDVRHPISIPAKDLDKLVNTLMANNKKRDLGLATQTWLLAGIAAGLRPSEWEFAELLEYPQPSGSKQYVLKVKNSKRKAAVPVNMQIEAARQEFPLEEIHSVFDAEALGASIISTESPEHRFIPLDQKDAMWVESHLYLIQKHLETGEPFEKYYEACRKCLVRACQHAFKGKKIYTLYVLRHQFAANAKAKYSREEVAILMGHTNVASNNKYYAAKRYGHRKGHGESNSQFNGLKTTNSISETQSDSRPRMS